MANTMAERNRISVNIWTARIIPLILAGIVVYASYVLVSLLCVDYLITKHHSKKLAIAILVTYFVVLILKASSFIRLVHITLFDPPYLPTWRGGQGQKNRKRNIYTEKVDGLIAGGEYDGEHVAGRIRSSGGDSANASMMRNDPDSPGLEAFYTKDVFICGVDGKPKWCSECCHWKPDRTHHSKDAGRCIRKMDHFCPWVGGPIGENNFKFFIQFTGYTSVYCLHLLVVMAVYIHKQLNTEGESVNGQFAAILGLAGFFGLFTAAMTGTSLDLVLNNLTQVEKLSLKNKSHTLAVLKPPSKEAMPVGPDSALSTHCSYPEITYPLDIGQSHPRTSPISTPEPVYEPIKVRRSLEGTSLVPIPQAIRGRRSLQETSTITKPQPTDTPEIPPRNPLRRSTDGPRARHPLRRSMDFAPYEKPSRDRLATRTFVIVTMDKGINPWDLGSRLLNFRSVMGTNFLDYILPVRRSPCCEHEDSESHFQVGPHVDYWKIGA